MYTTLRPLLLQNSDGTALRCHSTARSRTARCTPHDVDADVRRVGRDAMVRGAASRESAHTPGVATTPPTTNIGRPARGAAAGAEGGLPIPPSRLWAQVAERLGGGESGGIDAVQRAVLRAAGFTWYATGCCV